MRNNKGCFVNVGDELYTNELLKEIQEKLDDKKEGRGQSERLIDSYILDHPFCEDFQYDYKQACVVLVPNYKMIFVNFSDDNEAFEDYILDFKEDIARLSSKHSYEKIIGRTRSWFNNLHTCYSQEDGGFEEFLDKQRLCIPEDCKRIELLISLLTNSINDIKRIGEIGIAENLLDKIKQKIILFDREQLNILKDNNKKLIIQGLSGTGKTELILHKIKHLYSNDKNSNIKIAFTCHNKILADVLKKRIPDFFDFMKVDKQIEWNERLWVFNSWGSGKDPNSGLYAYLCSFYNLTFRPFDRGKVDFSMVCQEMLDKLEKKYANSSNQEFEYAFDYIFIDESQDFNNTFFALCEKVSKNICIAGDIFQNIYDTVDSSLDGEKNVKILNKCYRTDPKTLMLGHSIGMGLLEEEKINWLNEDGWEKCGYSYEKKHDSCILQRNPLRRFEDLDDIESVIIENIDQDHWALDQQEKRPNIDAIIKVLYRIKEENKTVRAGDIAIAFIGKDLHNTKIDLELQQVIEKEFSQDEWTVNLAHRSKEKNADQILLTNENNIKGLEFPFVIVVACGKIRDHLGQRNKLYMMITRSMMQTYLLIEDAEKYNIFKNGFEKINNSGYIETMIPNQDNMDKIQQRMQSFSERFKDSWRTFYDELCDEYQLLHAQKKALFELLTNTQRRFDDKEETKDFIRKIILDFFNPHIES